MTERFTLAVFEIDKESNKEKQGYELEYKFYAECLFVVMSLTAGYWVDENRVKLAQGRTLTYEKPSMAIEVTIKENE